MRCQSTCANLFVNSASCTFKPFAQYTTLCCGEEYTTLSTVVPIIMELNCHLTEMEAKPGMRTVARVLLQEMHRRFDRYISPPLNARDALYVVATLLDPEYSLILTSEQVAEGVVHLKRMVKNFLGTQQSSTRHAKETQETTTTDREVEPPLKKFHHLSKIVSQQAQTEQKNSTLTPAEEVDHFISQRKSYNQEGEILDPLDFWIKSEAQYPTLSKVACDVLVIPASSTPIERTFSVAGNACIGKRNCLTDVKC